MTRQIGVDSELLRVVICAKTYPELSRRHTETVCTAGIREDGRPVRLYPVPLRYLGTNQKYALYDVIEVRGEPNPRDARPESFMIWHDTIKLKEQIPTDYSWQARREWLWKDPAWHFDSMDALKAEQANTGRSIGLLRPGEIVEAAVHPKPSGAAREHRERQQEIQSQRDFFLPEYKALDFIPVEYRLRWRCAVPCSTCRDNPHDTMILDWGLIQLGRKHSPEAARQKLADITNHGTHDVRLMMGSFFKYPQSFGVIALWHPPRRPQGDLFTP